MRYSRTSSSVDAMKSLSQRACLQSPDPIGPKLLSVPLTAPPADSFDAERVLQLARETFDIEARALLALHARQGDSFVQAVRAMLQCKGRVVVMGMGKSGHVGRKVAATLASTGTPALFVHPAEASHGDLGMVTQDDVVLAISNSGESDEIGAILPAIKRLGVTLVAMTGRPDSSLANHADITISSAVDQEACTLNLAPTASTIAQMAVGDALAVALLDARGFREEDFARSHPGGSLGRKLLMHVVDLMRSGDAVPRVDAGTVMTEMLQEMTRKGLGFTAVCDVSGRVAGIFTDGDLRRLIETGADLRAMRASDVMSASPKLVRADALAVEAADLMERHRVTGLLVVDGSGQLVAAINSNDLMR